MTALRVIDIVIYFAVGIYMASGAWANATGREVHRGDPMRLACFATAVVMIGFNLRWLMAAENVFVWKLLYVLSGAVGLYIISLGHQYGRGPLLRGKDDDGRSGD